MTKFSSRTFVKDSIKGPNTWAPLFDRLIDTHPECEQEHPIKKFYSKFETLQSIQREVEIILNSRSTAKAQDYEFFEEHLENFGLPQMFGIPEAFSNQITDQSAWPMLEARCKQAIERFEPRLKNVSVKVNEFFTPAQQLILKISGYLQFEQKYEEIYFPITLHLL